MNYQATLVFIIYILVALRGPELCRASRLPVFLCGVLQSRAEPKIQADINPYANALGIATG